MTKITGEVYQVGGSGLTAAIDGAVYLLRFGDRSALVDAATGDKSLSLFRNIQDCGVPLDSIEYLLITHCHYEHTGGIKAIKEEAGCQTVVHEKDAVFLENGDDQVTAASWYGTTLDSVAIDITLTGKRGELFLGERPIEWIHIPGHSPGSVVYCIMWTLKEAVSDRERSLIVNKQDDVTFIYKYYRGHLQMISFLSM